VNKVPNKITGANAGGPRQLPEKEKKGSTHIFLRFLGNVKKGSRKWSHLATYHITIQRFHSGLFRICPAKRRSALSFFRRCPRLRQPPSAAPPPHRRAPRFHAPARRPSRRRLDFQPQFLLALLRIIFESHSLQGRRISPVHLPPLPVGHRHPHRELAPRQLFVDCRPKLEILPPSHHCRRGVNPYIPSFFMVRERKRRNIWFDPSSP